MRAFSMGAIYAVPNAANPTPVPIASLKGCKVNFKQAKKKFLGNQRVALDVGDGEQSITIDIQNADFRASAMQLVAPGASLVTGGLLVATGETGTVPTTPFQITVTNSATWSEDGGVLDLTAGKWLTRVASAPTTGQYSVAAGVYTCAAADVTHVLSVVYTYSSPTLGNTLTFNNSIQSQSTAFKVRVYTPWTVNGSVRLKGFDFASVHFEELSIDFKVEDFAMQGLKGFASQDMIGTTSLVWKDYNSEIG